MEIVQFCNSQNLTREQKFEIVELIFPFAFFRSDRVVQDGQEFSFLRYDDPSDHGGDGLTCGVPARRFSGL